MKLIRKVTRTTRNGPTAASIRRRGVTGGTPPSIRGRAIRNSAGAALAVAFWSGAALAQAPATVTPGTANTFGGGNAALSLSRFDNATSTQTDVLFGRNAAGPYQLSWKNAHVGTDAVERNGVVLHAGSDYTIDFTAGTLTFNTPLRTGEMARVTYRCDTLNATPVAGVAAVPLQWDIWDNGQDHLRFSTLYRLNDGHVGADIGGSTPGTTLYSAVQFTGATRILRGSTATTGLFLDLQNGDWVRRGGWKLGDTTQILNGQLGFNYMRAGSQFAQADVSGIAAGRELIEATGKLTPMRAISLDLFARQTTALLSAPASLQDQPRSDVNGDVTRQAGGALSVALPQGARVSAGRSLTDTTPQSGVGTLTVKDNVLVASPVLRGTQATIGIDTQTTGPKDGPMPPDPTATAFTQTTTVGVRSAPNKFVTVTGTFQNTLDRVNPQDNQKVTVEATPVPALAKLKLTTSFEDRFQKDGVVRNRAALIDLPPLPLGQLKLSGGVQQNSASGKDTKEVNVGLVNVSARPLRYLEVNGGARLREGTLGDNIPDPNTVNTYTASLALAPWKRFKLTGDIARNPEGSDGAVLRVNRQSIGLQAEFGLLTLRSQYGYENDYINARLNNTADVGLDLHLSRWDTLTTAYKLQSLFDKTASGQSTYQLGYTRRISSIFDLTLSGLLTTYDQAGALDPDRTEVKAQAKFGLHF